MKPRLRFAVIKIGIIWLNNEIVNALKLGVKWPKNDCIPTWIRQKQNTSSMLNNCVGRLCVSSVTRLNVMWLSDPFIQKIILVDKSVGVYWKTNVWMGFGRIRTSWWLNSISVSQMMLTPLCVTDTFIISNDASKLTILRVPG